MTDDASFAHGCSRPGMRLALPVRGAERDAPGRWRALRRARRGGTGQPSSPVRPGRSPGPHRRLPRSEAGRGLARTMLECLVRASRQAARARGHGDGMGPLGREVARDHATGLGMDAAPAP